MVSRILKSGALMIVALSVLVSCDKPFKLDLPLAVDSHEYNLSSKAGQARVFFYTNRSWTLAIEPADCSWASVSRTSGNGQEDVEEILFTYDKNSDPDRYVILHITAGDMQESIKMFQTGIAREWWDGSVSVEDLVVKPLK